MIIYNGILKLYELLIGLASKLGYSKAITVQKLRATQVISSFNGKHIWIHAASAGEGNQAEPIANLLKNQYNYSITISFFSPSGYEFHKNSTFFDQVIILPLDISKNIDTIIEQIQPDAVIFIKKELWWHLISSLKSKLIPLFLVNGNYSSLFEQGKMNSYNLKCLRQFTRIYLTRNTIKRWPQDLMVSNIYSDTKYESSFKVAKNYADEILASFSKDKFTLLIGSSWPQEEEIINRYLKEFPASNMNIIIAPHEVDTKRIKKLEALFKGQAVLYSKLSGEKYNWTKVLIIDNIGLLKHAYKYCSVALIGGGFGKGIHNILEPVAYYKPTLFGPNYKKFEEAIDLVNKNLAFPFSNYADFKLKLNEWRNDDASLIRLNAELKAFVELNNSNVHDVISEIIETIQ